MTTSNGYVPTPDRVADYMAAVLFGVSRPTADDRVLYPGLGTGRLYDAVRRYCTKGQGWIPEWEYPEPAGDGVEIEPDLIAAFHNHHPDAGIDVHEADFLIDPPAGAFDYVIANPPYVRYALINADKREQYRERFTVATSQFDLYYCFFEQAIRCLRPGGHLVFLTPVRYLTLQTATPLRNEIRSHHVGRLMLMPDDIFDETVSTIITGLQTTTDPTISTRFWVEGLYGYEFAMFHPEIDPDVDDYSDQFATYAKRRRRHHRHVVATDRRERDHNDSEKPSEVRQSTAPLTRQSRLETWSG